MLRAIYGGLNTEQGWRTTTSEELENLYEQPKLTPVARTRQIRWLEHVQTLVKIKCPE